VRAGLAVALRRAGWELHVFTPTANPLRMLIANLNPAGTINAERVLIVVDQFEEVFTLCHDEIERIGFIEKLLSAAQDKSKNDCVLPCAEHLALAHGITLTSGGCCRAEYIGR
jgi:hypothetical protein